MAHRQADRVLSPTATEPEVSAHSGNAPLRKGVRLTANEREAVRGLTGTEAPEMFFTFKGVGAHCDLPQHLIRRTVRALARKGLAIYRRGLWTDCGEPAGSGYALTKAGRDMSEALGFEASYD